MFVRSGALSAAICAWFMLSFSTAEARQYVISFSGTLTNGMDTTGVFGPTGHSLAGEHFAATYDYDTLVGFRDTFPDSDHITPGNASVTIEGVSHPLPNSGGVFAASDAFATPGELRFDSLEGNDFPTEFYFFDATVFSPAFQPDLDAGVYGTFAVTGGGSFSILRHDWPGFPDLQARGDFTLDSIQIGTPEPGTWALLLTGFGLAGAALRRRRRAPAIGTVFGSKVAPKPGA